MSCVTLGMTHRVSEPQFPCLQMGITRPSQEHCHPTHRQVSSLGLVVWTFMTQPLAQGQCLLEARCGVHVVRISEYT